MTLPMPRLVLNCQASDQVKAYFASKGYEVMLFEGHKAYEGVRNHPDLYMFYDQILFCDPDVTLDIDKIIGPETGQRYPETVAYNLAKVGNYIIGLKKMVPKVLLDHFHEQAYEFVDVAQGYAKCSIAVVDDSSIMTSDKGIAKACRGVGIDVLEIEPGHIILEGFDYGFIGGCTVRIENDMFFSGDPRGHPDFQRMKDFLDLRELQWQGTQEPLRDLGSFIVIESV